MDNKTAPVPDPVMRTPRSVDLEITSRLLLEELNLKEFSTNASGLSAPAEKPAATCY